MSIEQRLNKRRLATVHWHTKKKKNKKKIFKKNICTVARKYEYCVVCYLKTEIVINKTKFDVYSDERMAECACYPSK